MSYKGIISLNEQNYATWKLQIEAYLWGNDLCEEAILPAPPGENATVEERRIFNRKNALAKSALFQNMEPHLLDAFIGVPYAKTVWNDLQTRFQRRSDVAILHLQRKLHLLQMKPNETFVDYFSRVKALLMELRVVGKPASNSEELFYSLQGITDKRYSSFKDSLKLIQGMTLSKVEEHLILKEEELHRKPTKIPLCMCQVQRQTPSRTPAVLRVPDGTVPRGTGHVRKQTVRLRTTPGA
jgi:hypothetical protein